MDRIGFYRGESDVSSGGVAPYADRLLRALQHHRFGGMEVSVLGGKAFCSEESTAGGASALGDALEGGGFVWRKVRRNGLFRRALFHGADCLYHFMHPRGVGRRAPYRGWLSRIHCDLRYDLLHFPFQLPPRLTFRCPFIVTMHDVQELHFPEFFSPEDRALRAELYWGSISQANRVVVSFDHVKEDLLRYFRLPDERVVVLPVPYSECGFGESDDSLEAEVSQKFGEFGRYYLYPAQTWRHKNHLGLIEAFERVRSEYSGRLNLVCTGVKNEYYEEAIRNRVERSPVRDSIHFLGVVSPAELKWLYRNSLSVVVPSLYEAGSFPLIEAMQLQMPVLCASTTSLPSTIGDERFVFDPRDAAQMGSMMLRMAVDDEYRQFGIKNSRERTEELRQIKVGPIVEELWRSTLEQSRTKS